MTGFDSDSEKRSIEAQGGSRTAAAYVRMSTEHQRYSTENQSEAIAEYAARRGYEIVRTYADEGKSGLRLDGRDALKRLIVDVEQGNTDFGTILVYDVSRWGRFQDADESAYYEYICKRSGIGVQYCAEQFENDGSPVSTIVKGVKRAMAGEYSRELSIKVFAGQCRLIELGYRQGGAAGYGLRRMLVDDHRMPKGELRRGEHKSLQTDRVVLMPGPEEEVAVVRRMYRAFLSGMSERQIAESLNADGLVTDLGRQWTRGTVHQVLTNEKYVGNNVFNRTSFKLKRKRVKNDPLTWVRCDAAFPGIVALEDFIEVQRIIAARSFHLSDEEMLARLHALLEREGALSGLVIDETEGMPSSAAYRNRFGSLIRAYQLVGYTPERDYRFIEINRALRRMHPGVVTEVIANIEAMGGSVRCDDVTDLLEVNGEFTASIVIVRCTQTLSGFRRWKVRFDASLRPDITVAVRMDSENRDIYDYYLLPRVDMPEAAAAVQLRSDNGIYLDGYRYDTLDRFFELAARATVRRAA